MSRTEHKLIATYAGKYGHYEIRRKSSFWGVDYYIYKNMDHWKTASTPQKAVEIIKDYDRSAKET